MVEDPDPDNPLRSAWRTYRRCLERIPSSATAAVVLQDDTIACPGFAKAAAVAFEAHPGRLIAFYHSTGPGGVLRRMEAALARCDPFFEFPMGRWVPTVALGWPVELAAEFLDWAANVRKVRDHWQTDDPLVGDWAQQSERGALATVPSLIEHPDDVPSYVKSHKGYGAGLPHRRAACWIGDVPVDRWLALVEARKTAAVVG